MQISPKLLKTSILVIVILIVLGVAIWVYWYYFAAEKSITIKSPNGGEELIAGRTYQITWKARGINKVGIALIKAGRESRWVAKDVSAFSGKYDWTVFTWEEPGQDYRISVSEYPWREGDKIDYSDDDFTTLGPRFASCDELSLEVEWPYIPSDFPEIRRVFITNQAWTGDLDGLTGADQKCQQEAEQKGLSGNWKALLGDDDTLAVDRLDLDGVFVEAESQAGLPYEQVPPNTWKKFGKFLKKARAGDNEKDAQKLLKGRFNEFLKYLAGKEEQRFCYRLLAKNRDELLAKLSDSLALNQKRLSSQFLNDLKRVWLGRINEASRKQCVYITTDFPSTDIRKNYSFTTTCQDWAKGVHGVPDEGSFPKCYTPTGISTDALVLAGLSSGVANNVFSPSLAKTCDTPQKLMCIEQ